MNEKKVIIDYNELKILLQFILHKVDPIFMEEVEKAINRYLNEIKKH